MTAALAVLPAKDARTELKVAAALAESTAPSEDAIARHFIDLFGHEYRHVSPWHQWLRYDGMRWRKDSTGSVYAVIRSLVSTSVFETKAERATANSAFVAGVERLARYDQRIVVLPEQLDADPWALNTLSGIVNLRDGTIRKHDPADLMTRIAGAHVDPDQGRDLWAQFLADVTQEDGALTEYLQRVAGYCATGVTQEDVLVYLFGIGSNGKSSWAEAIAKALGDYAMVFSPEVLMESKGERHPTELAQFMGVRLALSSEPSSSATWNDSRVKAMTGDATISARFMRGDNFTFPRTHKTLLIGNHMPRLNAITHAIRRRVQMVPFRAVFASSAGQGMRERLRQEALPAILAWIVAGAAEWQAVGTSPPECVRDLTADYLSEQDVVGQWLDERCDRKADAFERSGDLHRDYTQWCETQGIRPWSNKALSEHLRSAGFEKKATMAGKCFHGLKLKGTVAL
jgi:putative DNA primase/helicase